MAEKKLLIPLKDQPSFMPGTYDPDNIPLPNPSGLDDSQLETISSLGYGNTGVVSLVKQKSTGLLMAKKVSFRGMTSPTNHVLITFSAFQVIGLQLDKPRFLRHMHRALLILALNQSPFLIGYYGCFLSQPPDTNYTFAEASICLEFMDLGNVEEAVECLKAADGSLDETFVKEVVKAVVAAMEYLYEGFRAVHRDIKPANVLLNSKGEVKLADLGELGTLGEEGYAQTFVGTGVYMAVR
jgi:mitogen-activated protein kinase kinase